MSRFKVFTKRLWFALRWNFSSKCHRKAYSDAWSGLVEDFKELLFGILALVVLPFSILRLLLATPLLAIEALSCVLFNYKRLDNLIKRVEEEDKIEKDEYSKPSA